MRGNNSLGSILDSLGYKSVPSLNDPSTNGTHYYSGGYNTMIHGSAISGSPISSIQLELPNPGIRETRAKGGIPTATLEERRAALETLFHPNTIDISKRYIEKLVFFLQLKKYLQLVHLFFL